MKTIKLKKIARSSVLGGGLGYLSAESLALPDMERGKNSVDTYEKYLNSCKVDVEDAERRYFEHLKKTNPKIKEGDISIKFDPESYKRVKNQKAFLKKSRE